MLAYQIRKSDMKERTYEIGGKKITLPVWKYYPVMIDFEHTSIIELEGKKRKIQRHYDWIKRYNLKNLMKNDTFYAVHQFPERLEKEFVDSYDLYLMFLFSRKFLGENNVVANVYYDMAKKQGVDMDPRKYVKLDINIKDLLDDDRIKLFMDQIRINKYNFSVF